MWCGIATGLSWRRIAGSPVRERGIRQACYGWVQYALEGNTSAKQTCCEYP